VNLNQRIYRKITNHLRDKSGTSSWDFRTLNQVYPQICAKLIEIILKEKKILLATRYEIMQCYVPMRIDIYESRG
jgi:hypothetical protein